MFFNYKWDKTHRSCNAEDTGLNKVKWILWLESKTSGTLSLASVSIYMYIGVYRCV